MTILIEAETRLKTYSEHRKLAIIVEESLFLPQLLILTDTFAEKMPNTGMAREHEPTDPVRSLNVR